MPKATGRRSLLLAGLLPVLAGSLASAAGTGTLDVAETASTTASNALMEAWQKTAAEPQTMPVENLSLPIDHFASGRPRAILKAAHALVPPKGYIRARDMQVEMYTEEGRLEGIFLAEHCIYDRQTESGYCEGNVRIERNGLRVTGVNMVWQVQTRSVKILSQAEVKVERFIRGMGGLFK